MPMAPPPHPSRAPRRIPRALGALGGLAGILGLGGCLSARPEAVIPVPPEPPAVLSGDIVHALAEQMADRLPVLVVLCDEDAALGYDAAVWIARAQRDAAAAGAPWRAHLVRLGRQQAEAQPYCDDTGASVICRLTPKFPVLAGTKPATGAPRADLDNLRYPLPRTVAEVDGVIAAAIRGDTPGKRFDPEASEKDLAQAFKKLSAEGGPPPAREEAEFRASLGAAIAAPISAAQAGELCALVCSTDDHALHLRLIARLRASWPHLHDALEGMLALADDLVDEGDLAAARATYRLIAQEDGDAPVLARTARDVLANLDPGRSASRRAYEARHALDCVVVAQDPAAWVAAVGTWTPTAFFPVLLADERFTPRFIAAYRPRQVVTLASPAGAPAPDWAALGAAVRASWGIAAASAAQGAADAPADWRARLDSLGIAPDGAVFCDPASPLALGGAALAAGRFQPLIAKGLPQLAGGRLAQVHTSLSRGEAIAVTASFAASLDDAAPPRDGWRFITLAGGYPYLWRGEGVDAHALFALDDFLGREPDLERTAVAGRLLGSAEEGVYQAMCSLFLQVRAPLLVDTYSQNPHSDFGQFRLDPLRLAFAAEWRATLVQPAAIHRMREAWEPWSAADLVFINSSGGPSTWSIAGGGSAEDIPIGEPRAMLMAHSFSAADPWDPNTIAGRALWGGAWFYFGSAWEPFLSAFQTPAYLASRMRLGVSWGVAAREHMIDYGVKPWRLATIGDPRFAVRLSPQRRDDRALPAPPRGAYRAIAPGGDNPLAALRAARLVGGPSEIRAALAAITAQGSSSVADLDPAACVLALESCLVVGDCELAAMVAAGARGAAARDPDVLRVARIALGARYDRALDAGDLDALLARASDLVACHAPAEVVERMIGELRARAEALGRGEIVEAWLSTAAAAGDAATHGPIAGDVRSLLGDWAHRLALDRLLARPAWSADERERAEDAIVAMARGGRWTTQLQVWIDRAALRWSASSGEGPDGLLAGLTRAASGCTDLADALARIQAGRPWRRDWLVLGPFGADSGSWHALEAAAGAVDPAVRWSDGKRGSRAWTRPYRAQDFGAVDCDALFPGQERGHAYVAARIDADHASEGWLLLGSSGATVAWLDGAPVDRVPGPRAFAYAQDRVRIALAPGPHTLLVRLDRGDGQWSFAARIARDHDGAAALPGVALRCPLLPSDDAGLPPP